MTSPQPTLGTYRRYSGAPARIVSGLAVAFSVYSIAYVLRLFDYVHIFFDLPINLAIHLGLILALVYLLVPMGRWSPRNRLPWYDAILMAFGVGWNLYIVANYWGIYSRSMIGYLELYEVIGSWLNMLVVLEASRRLMGWSLTVVVSLFILYSLTAGLLPGFLHGPSYDWTRVGRYVGLFVTGLYGDILNISATVVVSFILFGQFLIVSGAGEWFVRVSQAFLGHVRGGPAKVAVFASSLMGTISGSGMANAATVGVFTIPLMKGVGYRPHFAGAVEAAASNGGQIMPPVMGIAAFIMADFLGMSYSRIILAGILPAIAYYVALFFMVDFEAARTGLHGIPRSQLPKLRQTLVEGWQFIIPLVFLIILLVVFKYSPELSAIYGAASLIVISAFNRRNRMTFQKVYSALRDAGTAMMIMAVTCAAAGMIIGCVQLTGLSYRLSMNLLNLAGGSTLALVLLTAVCALILGMGMTTSAVYLVMATLVAPALVEAGFIPIAAHFFVFYFGVAAMITPPVCPTSYVGAAIAGASPMRTGLTASRLAIVTFLAPFIFINQPALLWEGSALMILLAFLQMMIATVALASALGGYLFCELRIWWRFLFLAASVLLVIPSNTFMIAGALTVVALMGMNRVLARKRRG